MLVTHFIATMQDITKVIQLATLTLRALMVLTQPPITITMLISIFSITLEISYMLLAVPGQTLKILTRMPAIILATIQEVLITTFTLRGVLLTPKEALVQVHTMPIFPIATMPEIIHIRPIQIIA
jgi:hypothetical protein